MLKTPPAYLLLALAILLAIFLRFYQLNHIPPGFTFDEASHALDAHDLLQGEWHFLSTRLEQTAMGYMYLQAMAFKIWGESPLVSRMLTAFCGSLLIPINFWAVRWLFAESLGRSKSIWLATWSSLLIATSFWAVVASRLGYEYILTPVTELIALALFWSSYQESDKQSKDCATWKSVLQLVASACFSVASFYLYDGAMSFLLVIPVTVLLHTAICRVTAKPSHWQGNKFILFCFVTLLIALPLLLASYSGPAPAIERTQRKIIFNKTSSPTESMALLWHGLVVHVQPFLAWDGSTRWLMNIAHRPILDPVLAMSFLVGLWLCLKRLSQWPYLVMLVYWAGMLAPNVLTLEGSPRYFRMIGMLPATYFFIALAWVEVTEYLTHKFPNRTRLIFLPMLGWSLLWLPYQTYHDYFVVWANHPRVQEEHDMPVVHFIERMEQETDPQTIFLLPRMPDNPRHNYVIDFLHRGPATFRYVIVDIDTIETTLTQLLSGYQTVYYIANLEGARERHHYSVEYAIVPWLLSQHGQHVTTETEPSYKLEIYHLDSTQENFNQPKQTDLPAGFEPLNLTLVGQVKLTGWQYQLESKQLVIKLAWQGLTKIPIDFTVFVHLFNEQGEQVGGVDVVEKRGVKSLTPDEVLITDYTIPWSQPPGVYTTTVGLYYFEAYQQMVPFGSVTLPQPLEVLP